LNDITSVPNFMKIYQAAQNLLVGDTDRHTQTETHTDRETHRQRDIQIHRLVI
jgi:hypothetical protein